MDFHKPRYTPMSRRRRIYEGKAKVLYEGPEPGTLIQHFKDDATAFNAKKHEVIEGKGVLNNRISEYRVPAPERHRRADAFHPPAQHARAVDPRGRDHSARGGGAQRRRRFARASVSASKKARNCRARSSSSITRTSSSTIRWCRKSTSPRSAGRRRRRSTTSWRWPSASTTSCPGCSSASASVWSTSRWNAAGSGKTT